MTMQNCLWMLVLNHYGMLLDEEKNIILGAMHHIENRTCIRFKETAKNNEDFINIFPGVGWAFDHSTTLFSVAITHHFAFCIDAVLISDILAVEDKEYP